MTFEEAFKKIQDKKHYMFRSSWNGLHALHYNKNSLILITEDGSICDWIATKEDIVSNDWIVKNFF